MLTLGEDDKKLSLGLQTVLSDLINRRKLLFWYVTVLFRKMFLFRSLWSSCLLLKMDHNVSPMVQCRWSQGILENFSSRWHALECIGPRLQTEGTQLHDVVRRRGFHWGGDEEVCSGYWLGFSMKTGRPLDHSYSDLNSLKGNGKNVKITMFKISKNV